MNRFSLIWCEANAARQIDFEDSLLARCDFGRQIDPRTLCDGNHHEIQLGRFKRHAQR